MRTTISRAAPALPSSTSFIFCRDSCAFSTLISSKLRRTSMPKSAGLMSYSVIFPSFSSATRVLPVSVISSKPPSPHTTKTCLEPSCCNTRERMPHKSMWNTPKSWFAAPAGLVSGPKILKMLRKPSERRTGAT